MSIWQRPITLEILNESGFATAVHHVGIEFTEIGDDYLKARLPVDSRTVQPYGLLHGGLSVMLAETAGSAAATFSSPPGCQIVGLDINANHIRAVRSGWVTATARPVHRGRSTHVWQIDICNDDGAMVCTSRLTVAVLTP